MKDFRQVFSQAIQAAEDSAQKSRETAEDKARNAMSFLAGFVVPVLVRARAAVLAESAARQKNVECEVDPPLIPRAVVAANETGSRTSLRLNASTLGFIYDDGVLNCYRDDPSSGVPMAPTPDAIEEEVAAFLQAAGRTL
ncbi:MAG TPA: hypothetical protein VHM91_22075 [Verrucomicrobiales bacterium]|jgi:hypothetical protein|nr:hypothetical protein [Verrucomicrobiales bacterium]